MFVWESSGFRRLWCLTRTWAAFSALSCYSCKRKEGGRCERRQARTPESHHGCTKGKHCKSSAGLVALVHTMIMPDKSDF